MQYGNHKLNKVNAFSEFQESIFQTKFMIIFVCNFAFYKDQKANDWIADMSKLVIIFLRSFQF